MAVHPSYLMSDFAATRLSPTAAAAAAERVGALSLYLNFINLFLIGFFLFFHRRGEVRFAEVLRHVPGRQRRGQFDPQQPVWLVR